MSFDTASFLLGLLLGLVATGLAAIALGRARLDEAREAGRREREAELAVLRTRLEEQSRAAEQRYRDLEQARDRLKVEFQQLAQEILEDKARRFSEQNASQLGQLLNPLREQIGDFRKLVSDAYEKEGKERAGLQAELRQLFELNRQLAEEADSLTRALTADNRTQGYWGELKLERLLESAGLEKGQQYLTQESFSDEHGERYRPDALLLLPEDRQIVIDAKVALLDYQRACGDVAEAEREQHLARHAQALRNHVRQLGEKDYSRLHGLNSPDLVLMFVPVEAAFLEALRRDPDLYDYAYARKIILVGPSNLLASLRLVAQLWRTEAQNRNARAIAERGAALYDKFVGFTEDLARVGEALAKAQKAHDDALAKLSQGRGNLLRQVEMLRKLGVAPGKKLPPALEAAAAAEGEAEDEREGDVGADFLPPPPPVR
ncbi:DNA recombination protein RmuC [Arenimonas fontis]|uniref:DNA recombination protein RmuC n=1 Tax=Arenimonas fontis TaxID=2608255 RepID=A0A5B2Z934_9GAMM|nr:DNA recombination protein RmuC [Arenimonas fontis]KAA2284509.1 DNA recombination protein RmuC [Arenimonas fontis]